MNEASQHGSPGFVVAEMSLLAGKRGIVRTFCIDLDPIKYIGAILDLARVTFEETG
jgi:hypothetical protein